MKDSFPTSLHKEKQPSLPGKSRAGHSGTHLCCQDLGEASGVQKQPQRHMASLWHVRLSQENHTDKKESKCLQKEATEVAAL